MKQRITYLVLALCIIASPLYASTNGGVSGVVKDSKGKEIVRATIRIMGTSRGGFSAKDGKFEIRNIPAGQWDVQVSAINYVSYRRTVTISADQTTNLGTITLKDSTKTTQEVVVVGNKEKPITDAKTVAVTTSVGESELNSTAGKTNAQQAALTTSGVLSSGGGISIRGSRTSDTKMLVDGQDISDPISGGFGPAASATGDMKYAPTAAKSATADVGVIRGNAGAEYGNTTGGVINQSVKTGRNDRYEGTLSWMTDVPSLWGTAKNGLKALSNQENTFEFGIGGPLPGLDQSTFFISARYYADNYRTVNSTNYLGSGIDARDVAGNSLGHFPDNGSEVRNITGRLPIKITGDLRLQFGGSWGLTSLQTGDWGWMYDRTPAQVFQYNPSTGLNDTILKSTVGSGLAHANVLNNLISSYYVRVNQSLSDRSYYEATLSINSNVSQTSRRVLNLGDGSLLVNGVPQDPSKVSTSITGASFFGGYQVVTPADNYVYSSGGSSLVPRTGNQGDKEMDYYQATTGYVYLDNDPKHPFLAQIPNNLTGYVEGGTDASSTNNPYGLTGIFTGAGAEGFEFRSSSFIQFKGDYANEISVGNATHSIQGGVDVRSYTVRHYSNSLPWNGSPFYDVYDDQYGGDIYSLTDEERAIGSKPKKSMIASAYAQDQISFAGINFTPGLRLDVFNPSTQYSLDPTLTTGVKADATIKAQLSPRLNITYPIKGNTTYFAIDYGMFTQVPVFASLFDNTSSVIRRGNAIVGNPNLVPEKTSQYNVSYTTTISDNVGLEVTAYYKDIYQLTGIVYVPDNRYPYSLISNGEYGNVRGTEISLRRRLVDNFQFNINYTLQYAQGTSSGVGTNYSLVLAASDPYTDSKVFPLVESPLDYDRRHRLNFNGGFVFGKDEGPSIAGTKILQYFTINFTSVYQTGQPYTKLDLKGNQASDYNAERYPSLWDLDMHISRRINLGDLISSSLGNTELELYVDVINLPNRTEPILVYTRTQDPDNDGVSLYRLQGEFPAGWYATADKYNPTSTENSQYDRTGARLYNANADLDHNGVVTSLEEFTMYKRYVNDAIRRSSLYQYPRQVYFGVNIRF